MVAAAASFGFALVGSSAAHAAATVTVLGDDNNPLTLAQGAPAAIRNMSTTVGVGFANKDGRFSLSIAGPDGVAVANPLTCFLNDNFTRIVDFRGNGQYTISVVNYAKADTNCKTATSTETYAYSVNSSVAVASPTAPFLRRDPNSFTTRTLSLPVAGNPGAVTYDVQYAAGAVLAPDGSISGASSTGYVNRTTSTIDLNFPAPGTYTVVARAKNGQYASPWSPPVTVVVQVPFDISTVLFPDSIGPRYTMRGILRETSGVITGKVSLAMARRGAKKKYGKYRSIGTAKLTSKGTFTRSFTQRKTGTYKVRISYKGSSAAPKTTVYGTVKITRRLRYS
jgi:hypothetical protein